MDGSAAGGGFDFQARVIAWVAVHILAQRNLDWLRLQPPPIPVAVSAETGTPGDDVVVELAESEIELDAQAKKGLRADDSFRDTIDRFADGLTEYENRRFVLVVDGTSSSTIRDDLKQDLERLRGGRYDGLSDVGREVLDRVQERADPTEIGRIHVVKLQLLDDAAPHRQNAIDRLRELLADPTKAQSAWSCLVGGAFELIRQKGRMTRETLRDLLASESISVARSESAGTFRETQERLLAELGDELYQAHIDANSPDWDARFDTVRDLLSGGRPEVALELLRTIDAETNLAELEEDERAAYHNLRGVAHRHLGRTEEAEQAFQEALECDAEQYPALVNLGAIYGEEGRTEEGAGLIQRAVEVRPEGEDAWALRLRFTELEDEELEVPKAVQDSPPVLVAQVRNALERKDWDTINKSLRCISIENHWDELGIYQLLFVAEALHASAVSDPAGNNEDLLETALRACNRVFEDLPDEGAVSARAEAATVRGKLHFGLENVEDAVSDLRSAIRLSPADWRPYYQLALVHLERGEPEEALETICEYDGSVPLLLRGLEAETCLSLNQTDEAQAIINGIFDKIEADDPEEIRLMVAETALKAGLFDLTERILGALPAESTEQWSVRLIQARLTLRSESEQEAQELYEDAIELAPPRVQTRIRIELARHFQGAGELDQAIEQYETANVLESGDNEAIRGYAVALMNRQSLARATVVLNKIEERQGREPWVLSMQAVIASQTGSPESETELLRELLGSEPENHEARFRLGASLARQGLEDEAAEVVEELEERYQALAPDVLIRTARLASLLGRKNVAIRLGLRAVRLEPSEEIQFGYISVCFQTEGNEEVFQADTVEPGVVVKLQNARDPDDTAEYIIVDEDEHGRQSAEHSIDHDAVEPLVGCEVGDVIRRRQGTPMEETYEIIEIESLAAFTCRELTSEFPRQFPESTLLRSFRVGEEPDLEDFAPLIGTLTEGEQRRNQAISIYDENGLPIGMVAQLLGREVPKVYAYLASREDKLFQVEFSNREQFDEAVKLGGGGVAVLSQTSLMTIEELGIRDLVERHFDQIVLSQSLQDTLNAEIRRLEDQLDDGRMVMASVDGELHLVHEPPEETESYYQRRQDLQEWLERVAEVREVPVEAYDEKNETYRECLDRPSFECVSLVVGEDIPLFTDDLGLRRIQLETPSTRVKGFSTVAFLTAVAQQGRISGEDYARYMGRLISLNHFFVPLNADILYHILSDKGFRLDSTVIDVFERLQGEFCQPTAGARIGVELLRRVAISPASSQVPMVARLLVETLGEGNPLPKTLILLREQGRQRLALLPAALDSLEEAIVAYLQARGLA